MNVEDENIELSEEEKLLIKTLAQRKFRILVNKAINNLKWLIDTKDEECKPPLNINTIYEFPNQKSSVNAYDKSILLKLHELRTEDEKKYLCKRLIELKFYRGYSQNTKKALIEHTRYNFFGQSRKLLNEGYKRDAIYYLFNGNINVFKREMDIVTKKIIENLFKAISDGNIFGKEVIYGDLQDTFTYVTNVPCDILYIMKEDFENIMKIDQQKHWDDIRHFLSRFTYFSSLKNSEIQLGCMLGKIISYEASTTILGDGKEIKNQVYFVLSGKCQLIETLHLLERTTAKHAKNYNRKNISPQIYYAEKAKPKIVYMQVCIFNEGSCFNLGESYENRRVVTINRVKCMLLPAFWLFQKSTADMWLRVAHFLKTKIPSSKEVHKQYLLINKWNNYKANLIDDLMKEKNSHHETTIHDIPYSIRIDN